MDPPGILVTQSERQRKRNRVARAMHHVQVRVAGSCRTDPDHSMNATDFVVGGPIHYEIDNNKANIKTPQNKKVSCKIVRVGIISATP